MPKIFAKDCKIKVIEYGTSQEPTISWRELKERVQGLIPTASLLKIVKRAS